MTHRASREASSASRRPGILALLVAIPMVLAGCGGSATASSAPVASAATSVPATAAPVAPTDSAAPSSSDAGGCGGDAAATIKTHLTQPAVVSITIIGGCHQASIATSLAASDSTTGLAICDSAAEVAYVGGISSITVLASDNSELATGLKDAPCIGEF